MEVAESVTVWWPQRACPLHACSFWDFVLISTTSKRRLDWSLSPTSFRRSAGHLNSSKLIMSVLSEAITGMCNSFPPWRHLIRFCSKRLQVSVVCAICFFSSKLQITLCRLTPDVSNLELLKTPITDPFPWSRRALGRRIYTTGFT